MAEDSTEHRALTSKVKAEGSGGGDMVWKWTALGLDALALAV
jgi:hypothetical protein